MKIAILGTKGVPNNYGGFEQFAEYVSVRLAKLGHSVTVYNPHFHPYRQEHFGDVKIIRKYSPEKLVGGGIANIIYDHLCLTDALEKDFDIIYEAGYHSVALSYKLLNIKRTKRPVILTNMDGLEWQRSKWNKATQRLIESFEKIAVQKSPYLIADNTGIQEYLKKKYNAESFYLPYGADVIEHFDPAQLKQYDLLPHQYFILIARLEPENNVETIISACQSLSNEIPLLVIGNHNTPYGNYLKNKFRNPKIRFLNGIYNKSLLDSLRHFSLAYFHGHSVGGTNPSLLEAMASQSFIIAHKNPFNESILNNCALYFTDTHELLNLLNEVSTLHSKYSIPFKNENFKKIKELYNWDVVTAQHEALFQNLLLKS